MTLSNEELTHSLDSVISVIILPYRGGEIDYDGIGKNVDYLIENNHLDDDRPRVIAVAGTSLIHHVAREEQTRIMDFIGKRMGNKGVLMSGIAPNPLADAGELIEAQAKLSRPPDCYLIMPVTGVVDPGGFYDTYMSFAERHAGSCGARLLYYMRESLQAPAAIRLVNDSPHFVGIKVGTTEDDVPAMVDGVNADSGIVMWGIGDRSTGPASKGTKGHTSGVNLGFVKASDAINNAQRKGDYDTGFRIEKELTPIEAIRFRDARKYNYSAVVEAIHHAGWDDVVGGEGGPFNPRVPPAVSAEVKTAIAGILHYH
jgi:dihydrodipicolinate synthase/N-acetylneuraminate lyase